jgi:hypothetical protein
MSDTTPLVTDTPAPTSSEPVSTDTTTSTTSTTTDTPRPTPRPTPKPTPKPTPRPTPRPPTRQPTPVPTPEPTPEPTPQPTPEPSPLPTPPVTLPMVCVNNCSDVGTCVANRCECPAGFESSDEEGCLVINSTRTADTTLLSTSISSNDVVSGPGVAGWQIGLIVAFSILIVIGVVVLVVVLRRQSQNPANDGKPSAVDANLHDAGSGADVPQLSAATPTASKGNDIYVDSDSMPEWMMSSARSVPSSTSSGARAADMYSVVPSQPSTGDLKYVSLASVPAPGLGASPSPIATPTATPAGSRKFSNQPPPPLTPGSRKFSNLASSSDGRDVSMRAPKSNYDSVAPVTPTIRQHTQYQTPARDMYNTLPATQPGAPPPREKNYIPLNEV